MRIGFPALLLGLLVAGTAHGQEGRARESQGGVYKCTDEKGAVTYSTSPCKGAKREFLSKEKLERKTTIVAFPKPAPATPIEPAAPRDEPPAKPSPAPAPATTVRSDPAAPVVADDVTASPTLPAQPKIRKLPIEKKKKKD